MCHSIIKAKIYNDKEIVRVADALFGHAVAWAAAFVHSQRLHLLTLLNTIIDKNADYYKNNGRDGMSNNLFGEPKVPDDEIVKFVDGLKENDMVDAFRTTNSRKIWTRATFLGREQQCYKIRYYGESLESFVSNKYYELAPLGSRSTDFGWREGLKVGDRVDYDSYSIYKTNWKLCVITEVKTELIHGQEVSKSVFLTEILPDGREAPKDFHFDSSGVKVHSPKIAKPGSRTTKLNSSFDDCEDALFLATEKKEKFAIVRMQLNVGPSNYHFVRYINIFGDRKGFESMLKGLNNSENTELTGAWIRLFQSMVDNLVEPFVTQNGLSIFKNIKKFGLENTEKNLRNFSVQNLAAINDSLAGLAQRIFPAEKARDESKNLTLMMAFLCIKSDFLQKQLHGAKMLEGLELKAKLGDVGLTRSALVQEIQREGLFDKIVKAHPSLVAKSATIFRMLFSEKVVSEAQMETLWEQIRKTDLESRKALISLLKDVAYELSADDIRFLLTKMRDNVEAISEPELELIMSLKRWGSDKFKEVTLGAVINEILWGLLQRPNPGKKEFMKELSLDFVRNLDDLTPLYTQKVVDELRARRN